MSLIFKKENIALRSFVSVADQTFDMTNDHKEIPAKDGKLPAKPHLPESYSGSAEQPISTQPLPTTNRSWEKQRPVVIQ